MLVTIIKTIIIVGTTTAEADELPVKDGDSIFVVVRATNMLGYVQTLRSNGITVKLEPMVPGNVRDGDIIGVDLNYQPSVSTLSANWDGFGPPKGVYVHGTSLCVDVLLVFV